MVLGLDVPNIWDTKGVKDTCCTNRQDEKAGQEGMS